MDNSTFSNAKPNDINIDLIKEIALRVDEIKTPPLPKGLGWLTKLMNRFGWYRKYEVIVIDIARFKPYYDFMKPNFRDITN